VSANPPGSMADGDYLRFDSTASKFSNIQRPGLVDGAVATPSLEFDSDEGTGTGMFYGGGTGKIHWATDGTLTFEMDNGTFRADSDVIAYYSSDKR